MTFSGEIIAFFLNISMFANNCYHITCFFSKITDIDKGILHIPPSEV